MTKPAGNIVRNASIGVSNRKVFIRWLDGLSEQDRNMALQFCLFTVERTRKLIAAELKKQAKRNTVTVRNLRTGRVTHS